MVTQYEELKAAIALLADGPERQLQYLKDIGLINPSAPMDEFMNVDELALRFEDANYATSELIRSGFISEEAGKFINKLDAALNGVSGEEFSEFWTIRALEHDARWQEIRELSQICLCKL